ncbi:MAG: PP2C family protein-serine/threonine phosphatase [Microscillaceae bacterium]|nr:PP2C family protein-serine/threonine phosphatase [Microscillaceae bacterium]MDW8460913.1 PP2C family protein-serine/threonine phosphatase [Cytophagales bacterium]
MTPKENNISEQLRSNELVEMELRSILDISQAINNNTPEENLYKIYRFSLIGSLKVKLFALYVLVNETQWECKVYYGTKYKLDQIALEIDKIIHLKTTTSTKQIHFEHPAFQEFDWVIPIQHKDRTICFLFTETYQGATNPEDHLAGLRFVQTLTNILTVAIENRKLVQKQLQQEAFKKEMEIAKHVQNKLFPRSLPYNEHVQIKATYIPHTIIGGDYYDYIPLDNHRFMICIADISGKAIGAALVMSNVQATLRVLMRQAYSLKHTIEKLNYFITEITLKEEFVTFFIAIYDTKNHTLEYINAGHNPAILYDIKHGQIHQLSNGCTVLGAFEPLPFINETTINNLTNFLLFCYTDGLTEAKNPEGELFNVERVIQFMQSHKYTNLEDLNNNLIKEVRKFMRENEFHDDITILSLRVMP